MSSEGHGLEYRFDWGDAAISAWGSASQSHSWSVAGAYGVKAQARCATDTGVESAWSLDLKAVTVNPAGQIGGVVEDWSQWEEVAWLPAPRGFMAAAVLDGGLYAMAGELSGTQPTNVYRYDGTAWTEVAGLPEARNAMAAGVLNGKVYAVGGYTGVDALRSEDQRVRVRRHDVDGSGGAAGARD